MEKLVTLVSPNLMVQKSDLFTTGVVYMPIGLAYTAGFLRSKGIEINFIDSFGEKPNQIEFKDDFISRGLSTKEVCERVDSRSDAIFLYAPNLTSHGATIDILNELSRQFRNIPIVIVENTQAVTAYSLKGIADEFFKNGASYILTGESEYTSYLLLQMLRKNEVYSIPGVLKNGSNLESYVQPEKIADLNLLPFPAWDLLPIHNYWHLKYSHGPLSSSSYLPILSSRGCPYSCRFCVIPETNNTKWRSRSPENVVEEMNYFYVNFGVKEFHIEDVNPTINDKRIRQISEEIIKRELNIVWKICAGTKVESIRNEETVYLMAKSGCKYVSISPESGSDKIMKLINKPFNYDHAVKIISYFNKYKIYSQACFVLGFPGEDEDDRKRTLAMVKDLTIAGVDEIAQFIITPVPGSYIYKDFRGFKNYSELNFSPTWRDDYKVLNKFRINLYRKFLVWKMIYHPFSILKQPFNFLFRKFNTKMEMVPYRAFHVYLIIKRNFRTS